jgi:hypothetical protein
MKLCSSFLVATVVLTVTGCAKSNNSVGPTD